MSHHLFSNHIEAYLIESPINRLYFTGCSTSAGFLIMTENEKTFYADPRYYEEAKANFPDITVECVKGSAAYGAIVQNLLKAGIKTLGYEDDYVTVSAFKKFEEAFGAFELVPASGILTSLRLIKSPEEIAAIAAAQRIAEKVFGKVTGSLRPGVTEKELRAQIAAECFKCGADELAFRPIVAFGENTAVPHHNPSDRKLEKNDLILLDFGVKLNGYNSDMTRTFCLNDPGEPIARLYETVLAAQSYALKHIKAGMTCREADSLAREYMRANGYESEFSHGLGHGVGLMVHEPPTVNDSSHELLLPGMVVTLEPGVYVRGLGGVRIEDMAVVREDGVENLTTTVKELIL